MARLSVATAQRRQRYQRLRRLVLGSSIAATLLVPLAHLGRDGALAPGHSAGSIWSGLADAAQSVELPWLGAPWSVRAFGVEFLDPVAGLGLLVTGRAGVAVLLGLLPTLALIVLFGRFFCGWLCPYLPFLAASNAARALAKRTGLELPDLTLPRRTGLVVLGLLLSATALTGRQWLPLFYPPSVIGRAAFQAVFFGSLGTSAALIGAALAFDTFVSRAGFCRYLCPGGTTLSLLSRRSRVSVVRRSEQCIACAKCDVACNLLQQPMTDRLDEGCERCGKCIAACPTDALGIQLRLSREERKGRP